MLSMNQNITMDIIEGNKERSWSFYYISANPNITMDFIIKYENRIRFEVLSDNPLTLMNEL